VGDPDGLAEDGEVARVRLLDKHHVGYIRGLLQIVPGPEQAPRQQSLPVDVALAAVVAQRELQSHQRGQLEVMLLLVHLLHLHGGREVDPSVGGHRLEDALEDGGRRIGQLGGIPGGAVAFGSLVTPMLPLVLPALLVLLVVVVAPVLMLLLLPLILPLAAMIALVLLQLLPVAWAMLLPADVGVAPVAPTSRRLLLTAILRLAIWHFEGLYQIALYRPAAVVARQSG